MKFFKKAIITVLILILVLVGLGLKTFYDAGEFKKITPHFDGQVQTVGGVLSSEDITIHPPTAMAFISSDGDQPAESKRLLIPPARIAKTIAK